MAGKRKTFKNYNDAQAFVVTLGLQGMQDWIKYAKSGNRPADIPSNPWNTYKDELASMDPPVKFSINEFIGCKLPRAKMDPNAPKKPRKPRASRQNVQNTVQVDEQIEAQVDADNMNQSPFEMAREIVRGMNLQNRDAFNDMKRKNMLPAGVPRNPDSTFKDEWNGWGDFLGNVKKSEVEEVATF